MKDKTAAPENDLEVDMKNYAKYLLEEGTIDEKREMLSCLKSRIVLKENELLLEIWPHISHYWCFQ